MIALLVTSIPPASADEEDLVGLRVGRRTAEALLVVKKEGRYWLPVEESAQLLSVRIDENDGAFRLLTPLGAVMVPPGHLTRSNGVRYLDQRFLEERLNTVVRFQETDYTILVDPPWPPGAPIKTDSAEGEHADSPEPEAVPPRFGLATVHGDMAYRWEENGDNSFDGYLRATGHAYGGVWQVTYEEDFAYRRQLRDAVWMRQINDVQSVQIGHQNVGLHPLLASVEMTGAQYAWTSSPRTPEGFGFHPGALVGRRARNQRTFEGTGPVGGYAELWLNDQRIAETGIGISGQYQFSQIDLPARQSRIEIRIYDRRGAAAPVDVVTETLNLSELLLEAGESTLVTGGGIGGNVFDQFQYNRAYGSSYYTLEEDDDESVAGFAFARHAPWDGLTLEAGTTLADHAARATLGAVARLGVDAVGSASVAIGEDTGASYLTELNWRPGPWRVIARSFWRQRQPYQQYHTFIDEDLRQRTEEVYDPDWDHYAEVGYQFSDSLSFGIIARSQPEATFALPFVSWRPLQALSITARPDELGDYRIDARYGLSSDAYIHAARHTDTTSLSYVRRIDDELTLTAELEHLLIDSDTRIRAGLGLSGHELLGDEIGWHIAGYAGLTGEDFAMAGSLRRQVVPGVQAYIEAYHEFAHSTYASTLQEDELRVRLGLSFDLARTDNGLVPAPYYGVSPTEGSLAGRLALDGPQTAANLADIPVLVDGRVRTRTDENGSFFVPQIERGVHIVEFDDENLPIEYVARKRSVVAAIEPGAVTPMMFQAEAEYGVAGQVIGKSGSPAAQLSVVVLDAAGIEKGRGLTNSFGYYRIDGLSAGSYRLIVREAGDVSGASGTVRTLATRSFAVTDDYAFDTDVTLHPGT